MVWRQLPKLVPAGSIPVSCSKTASFLHRKDAVFSASLPKYTLAARIKRTATL